MTGQVGDTKQHDCDGWPVSSTEDSERPFDLIERLDQDRGGDTVMSAEQSRQLVAAVLFTWWAVLPGILLLLTLAVGAYAMKSWLNIDLFDSHFILHGLFFE